MTIVEAWMKENWQLYGMNYELSLGSILLTYFECCHYGNKLQKVAIFKAVIAILNFIQDIMAQLEVRVGAIRSF